MRSETTCVVKPFSKWAPANDLYRLEDKGGWESVSIDPYFISPLLPSGCDPRTLQAVEITIAFRGKELFPRGVADATLSWESSAPILYGLTRRIPFHIRADGEPHTYRINLADRLRWIASGDIQSVRLDPVAQPGTISHLSLKWIPSE